MVVKHQLSRDSERRGKAPSVFPSLAQRRELLRTAAGATCPADVVWARLIAGVEHARL